MKSGILYALGAYLIWGMFPVYFKAVAAASAGEILAHRMAWSLVFALGLLAVMRNWGWVGAALRSPKDLRWFVGSAILISINWLLYIWAVNTDRVIDASLGYFINPLVNVVIGAVVLRERLRRLQWMAVGLATGGVAWLAWQAGEPPWIGLAIAFSFAGYGLLRKKAPLGAIEGFALEVALLFPFAAVWILWLALRGEGSFVNGGLSFQALLVLAGPITAVPLLLFAAGARRIPFSTLGLLQYVGPTLQVMLGVWLYREPFGGAKLVGYSLVWAALVVFAADGLRQTMRKPQSR